MMAFNFFISLWQAIAVYWRRYAVVTCPSCGEHVRLKMPTDSCRIAYQCRRCKTVLRPKDGDCCIFCSYSNYMCPPKMESIGCERDD